MPQHSAREAIVDAAVEALHAHGFHGTGVKDITDAAGVPKGSLYNHFRSKDEIAVEAMNRYGAGRGVPALASPGIPALERLQRHFSDLRREFVEHEMRRGCLYGNFGAEVVDHSETVRAAVHGGFTAWREAITVAIAEAQADGAIENRSEAGELASYILSAWEGALIQARASRSPAPLDAFFAVTFTGLLH
jgi:TetR/AcrR family transcriptional repressor of nem operon